MTNEEYKQKVEALNNEYNIKKSYLTREFAFSNNPYKEGDIITDHIGSICITKIRFQGEMFSKPPECVYEGRELKKDKTPTKKESYRKVWQSNLISDEQDNH